MTDPFDPIHIQQLRRYGDAAVAGLLDDLARALRERLVAIDTRLAAGDRIEAARLAHLIRSSAGALGATVLVEQSRLIEHELGHSSASSPPAAEALAAYRSLVEDTARAAIAMAGRLLAEAGSADADD